MSILLDLLSEFILWLSNPQSWFRNTGEQLGLVVELFNQLSPHNFFFFIFSKTFFLLGLFNFLPYHKLAFVKFCYFINHLLDPVVKICSYIISICILVQLVSLVRVIYNKFIVHKRKQTFDCFKLMRENFHQNSFIY